MYILVLVILVVRLILLVAKIIGNINNGKG